MKKAKVMLLSIAVIAIVGGALAFNAKKFDTVYCYSTTDPIQNPGKFCDATTDFSKPGVSPDPRYYYTTLDINGNRVDDLSDCPHIACPSTTLAVE